MLREVLELDDRIADGAHAPSPSRTASRSAQSRRLASESRWQASECPPSMCREWRPDLVAGVEAVRAAGMERAAGRQVDDRRGKPLDRTQVTHLGLHARHRLEESPGVRVLRAVEHLGGGPVLDRTPGVHHHHGLGRLRDHPEVVGDQDHADVEVALDLVDELEDLRLHRHVERCGGLIGDQHGGVVHQRHRDHGPLAHAARELVG